MNNQYLIELLKNELQSRKKTNPQYSLRAFAKSLDISPTALSRGLTNKQLFSNSMLDKISQKLNLDQTHINFIKEENNTSSNFTRLKKVDIDQIKSLDQEAFSVVSDWYHFAILELINLNNFQNNTEWIAGQLNISTEQVNIALSNLFKTGLIKYDSDQKICNTYNYTTLDNCQDSSLAMKIRLQQILKLAENKIQSVDSNNRDNSAITISIDPNLLPEVKSRIKKFRRSLGNYITENSKDVSQVYELQINFIPLTKGN